MTLDAYRADLEKLLDETKATLIQVYEPPMSLEKAIQITHAARKEGMILDEMKEVDGLPDRTNFQIRHDTFFLKLDDVPIPSIGDVD